MNTPKQYAKEIFAERQGAKTMKTSGIQNLHDAGLIAGARRGGSRPWRIKDRSANAAIRFTTTTTELKENMENVSARNFTTTIRIGLFHRFAFTLLLLLAWPAVLQAQFNYTTNDGAITITGYAGTNTEVTIPNAINGLPVISIGDGAFYSCASLTGVTVPDSVTNIGGWAFSLCTSLTIVSIPGSVTSIEDGAFDSCTSLTNVMIGYGVTSIGDLMFSDCTNLASVNIPSSVTYIGIWAFGQCRSLSDATIPDSVTNIGDCAFYHCTKLTSVTIPSSVKNFGEYVFESCISLTNVTIQHGVTIIGNWAFLNCTNLISVTIPGSVTNIGVLAFSDCASLTSVIIPSSVTSIGYEAFIGCASLTTIAVDAYNMNYASLDGVLFDKNCGSLLQYPEGKAGMYVVPNGVTSIMDEAFYSCASLTSVSIPASVTNIGNGAFLICSNLTAIGVDLLNLNYSSVDGVLFDKNRTALLEYPGGKAGTYIVPFGVTSIASGAFYNCASLTSIRMPGSVTSIGDWAFFSCTSMTNVTMENGLARIREGAFRYCSNLTSVVLPGSVNLVCDGAFSSCVNLTAVYFAGNAPEVAGFTAFFESPATAYYLSGTTGWNNFASIAAIPVALWLPRIMTYEGSVGVQARQFGFNIAWTSGQVIVVEVCTDLVNPNWCPVATNTLTSSTSYFSDPQWTNYPGRFYRIRSP
jgi:hypothetical protein